jgi:peptidyl-prolyl cis-trans isomerase C
MKAHGSHEKGNAVVVVLIILAVVAVGALAYLSGQMAAEQKVEVEPGSVEAQTADAENTAPQIEITPGNPVVARVNGEEITRLDVVNHINTLPLQVRQMPLDQLFPAAVDQLVVEKIIAEKAENVNLDDNSDVQERLAAAKKEIVQTVFLQKTVNDQVTEEAIQNAYNQYKENFPEIQEVKASHILVEDKDKALELISQLEGGADFAELARENSIDQASAQNGGDLGYFSESDVVPEFGVAAFATDTGSYTYEPVQSEFGYHIIKVEDKRIRPVPPLADVKQAVEAEVRRQALQNTLSEWKEQADVEEYGINGKEGAAEAPAATEEAPSGE